MKGFVDTNLARRAGKIGKRKSPWNNGPMCPTKKAALGDMKYKEKQKKVSTLCTKLAHT